MLPFDADAIFVDGGMPTLDGCEFLRKLRRMQGGDGPKAVICLNENDVAQIARAMHAGASDFMMKPFDADHVRANSPSSALSRHLQLRLLRHGRIVGDFRGGVRPGRFRRPSAAEPVRRPQPPAAAARRKGAPARRRFELRGLSFRRANWRGRGNRIGQ